MPRPSTIETLPPDILERLQELLRDPRVRQFQVAVQINKLLAKAGYPERVSKSAVNRYAQRMEEVGAKLRQSREIADMWIGKLGAAPQGKVGQLVNEILRTLAFDLSSTLQEGELNVKEAPGIAKMLKDMAIAMEKLEKAASENLKREEDIRKQERERLAAELAELEKAEGGKGMHKETLRKVRALYGLAE